MTLHNLPIKLSAERGNQQDEQKGTIDSALTAGAGQATIPGPTMSPYAPPTPCGARSRDARLSRCEPVHGRLRPRR